MEESLTQGTQNTDGLQTQPTDNVSETPKADVHNQETISGNEQETVSDDSTANQNNGGAADTDDGLAKFAKGQGYSEEEFSALTEREKNLLKLAKDNQKAYRSKESPKLHEAAAKAVDAPKENETEDEEFKREFRQYKYERQVDQFWSDETRDRSLEPVMTEILNEKIADLTPVLGAEEARKYAFNLSRDLGTLHDMAKIKSGTFDPDAARQEGRREERDSIRRQAAADAPNAHATTSTSSTPKVDRAWLEDTYNPANAEHRELLAEAMARGDLY